MKPDLGTFPLFSIRIVLCSFKLCFGKAWFSMTSPLVRYPSLRLIYYTLDLIYLKPPEKSPKADHSSRECLVITALMKHIIFMLLSSTHSSFSELISGSILACCEPWRAIPAISWCLHCVSTLMAKASKLLHGRIKPSNVPGKKASSRPVPGKPPKFPPLNDGPRVWLIKSEPVKRVVQGHDILFSLASLKAVESEPWTGVRNYEARNNLLHMKKGDLCLFYHSNCSTPGIVGLAQVFSEAEPDPGQFIKQDPYYDAKLSPENPRWWCPQVLYVRRLRRKLTLTELKDASQDGPLSDFMLIKRGRLSVIPVRPGEYEELMKLEQLGEVSNDIDCDIDYEEGNDPKIDLK